MANLLRWSVGMSLPKKKDENVPLISSLRTLTPTISQTGTLGRSSSATNNNAVANNTVNSSNNNAFKNAQQVSTINQQAELRKQRLEQIRQQQEKRKQEEAARKLREQNTSQTKQNSLLSSAGLGGSPFQTTDLRANLEAQKQNRLKLQQQQAAKKAADEAANPWKKYYEEEKQKVRDQAFKNDWGGSTLQDIFNAGWDRRLAEVNARNRYTSEMNNKAFDDNGNVIDEDALAKAKDSGQKAINVARQYGEQR